MMTKGQLIAFENEIVDLFHAGKLPYPIHFSGGNELRLIKYFADNVKLCDWVFSTWRSHYHALLKGIPADILKAKIMRGDSMHVMSKEHNFFASSIVGGCCPIAVGVAKAIQMKGEKRHVHLFIGDGGEDQGVFYESVRYAKAWDLPITFIIEDNALSVDTTKKERINDFCIDWPDNVIRYHYNRKWPHVQTGKIVSGYSDTRYM
jgi:TPP-dependent pyruvate/acetoin dehydrogenase alpha subunit